jgi:hypothetical protein
MEVYRFERTCKGVASWKVAVFESLSMLFGTLS